MSRLESLAKAGYFPTPPRVVALIANHLVPTIGQGRHVARLLDPCAGMGEAAGALARKLRPESYGIEINAERAQAASICLDHVLETSAFTVRLAHSAFSCLVLNPPFAADEEKHRLEHAFLMTLTRALVPGGILAFIIPQRRLATSARYLASHRRDARTPLRFRQGMNGVPLPLGADAGYLNVSVTPAMLRA